LSEPDQDKWKPRSAARSGVRQHYGVNRFIVGFA